MEATSPTTQFNGNDAILHRVLGAVAEKEACEPLELPPLYDAVDPDALGQVLRGTGVTEISFPYHGHDVSIGNDGRVRVL